MLQIINIPACSLAAVPTVLPWALILAPFVVSIHDVNQLLEALEVLEGLEEGPLPFTPLLVFSCH